tara:strand:- start:803 stop:2179 length:1377 start_codon:yes stop_codon:yes gene_type:complete
MSETADTTPFSPPLPDDRYSPAEKAVIWTAVGLSLAVMAGLVLAYDTVWTETLRPIIWEPVVEDAGVAGDAGYTPQNTAIYTLSMLGCVVLLQALFRKWRLPTDERMTVALIAWVCLAPVLRVLEDADFFSSTRDVLFISPIIHLHLAAWLVGIAVISQLVAGRFDGMRSDQAQEAQATLLGGVLFLALMAHWYLLYQPAYGSHADVDFSLATAGVAVAVAVLWGTLVWTRMWPAITRGMMAFATSAVVLGVAHWVQFMATPWAQESGKTSGELTFWPVWVVLGLPGLVCFFLYRMGKEDARQLTLTGHVAGVLPGHVGIKQWEEEAENWADHPVEFLSNKALLAHPMVLGMVFGQLCDGFATMVGIDMFGYGEKHPVSNAVIQYGGRINETLGITWGEGAWLFALVKAMLVGLIVWLFVQMRVEQRQQHFRLLIVLAVLIVGLAPGLRDIGRLMLGV